jgi:hypothetical protein
MELIEKLDMVTDRDSFFAFVAALIADREDEVAKEKVNPSPAYGPGANGWENGSIEAYLEASLACAVDSGDFPEEASWQAFASFLFFGKGYE